MTNDPKGAQWPITNDDKEIIRDLGRKLHKMVLDYAKEKAVNGTFHVKLVSGAFQYVEYILGAKAQLIGDDVLFLQDSIERFNLGNLINEPFQPTPTPSLETMKEEAKKKIEEGQKELEMISDMEAKKDEPAAKPATPNADASVASATAA